VLIEGERIPYAGLVLPLSGRQDVPSEFGTRHRAALGLAEGSDAFVLVASEERGEVVVIDGRERPSSTWWSVHRLLFANIRYRL